jgi:alpha-amylase/alpha-mannosidase (GH57 family)
VVSKCSASYGQRKNFNKHWGKHPTSPKFKWPWILSERYSGTCVVANVFCPYEYTLQCKEIMVPSCYNSLKAVQKERLSAVFEQISGSHTLPNCNLNQVSLSSPK